MKQASDEARRQALEAQEKRESRQPYATELDDRDHERANKTETAQSEDAGKTQDESAGASRRDS
jgi:hypothetical protein